jgi:PAS domain S-box-containing protein
MYHEKSIELTSLLNTFSEAVILLDTTATILAANERAGTIVGADEHELSGFTLWQVAPQIVTVTLYQAVVTATRTRIPFQMTYHSPVTQTWLRVYLSPINEGIALFLHEEMASIPFQNSSCQCEGGHLDLLATITERAALLTPEGMLLEITQQPLTDVQVQREAVVGKPFIQYPLWSSAPVIQEQLRAAIAQASRGDIVRFEARVRLHAGQYLNFAITLSPHYDANQQIEYLTCVCHDITERKQAEEELRGIIEAIPQFVCIARPDGGITYANQRWLDYIGMTAEQSYGFKWRVRIHPDDQERAAKVRRAAIRAGLPYEVDYRIQNGANGNYRWFLIRAVPQKDAEGTVLSRIATITDIDKQKRAEERIKVSEQNLRVLAETMPQLVWTTQPDGRVDYTNQRYRSLTQADSAHLLDHGWQQFVHPEDIERVLALWQRSLEIGESYEDEYRLRDGDTGEYHWFLARALPVRDDRGQITKWFGTGTDIDGQKRTENALRQSQKREHALMGSNIIGVFITEGDRGEVIESNDTFLRMTGYSREDLAQRKINWLDMTAPEYHALTEYAHLQLDFQSDLTPYEKDYVCKDGTRLPVLVGGVMVNRATSQKIAFVLDNSARKELEQRKDDFLSMASHELRTPLTSLRLQTQMLRRQLIKLHIHTADAAFSRMEGQFNTITRLVEELFDISKIQAGKLEYAQETVNLNELLQEIVEVVQQTQTTHTIVMSGLVDPVLLVGLVDPVLLIGDRDRLGQVFLNLVSNAIKYSPEANKIEVDMTTSIEAVKIRVRDQGIGIPREQHAKIFERFYRAAPQDERTFPGLGMGLSIVLEIVKHYRGTITVESEVGSGSTFQVTLPRTNLDEGI